ncbi:FAD-binding oxidoreductase [Blastococcus sp. SYSU D00669]
MTQTLSGDIGALRAVVGGAVTVPGEPAYDLVRAVWNGAIDRRPAVVVECVSTADVSAAIGFARREGLEIAVRGGGHSMPGLSSTEGGLVVDLRRMNAVVVDPVARRVRVGGGALLGDVDAATAPHGLALPSGVVSHTGVGGLTLGGGMGWLTRQGGLSADRLLSAEVVVADGRVLRAAEDENADLFWALRGGGGNFGVVTEFEFSLVQAGPVVQFGLHFWDAGQSREALRVMRDVVRDLPLSLTAFPAAAFTAPPVPFVPPEHQGRVGVALFLVGFGDPAEHAAVAERVRGALPPLFEFAAPMPFTAVQQMQDEANAHGVHAYEKSCYLEDLTDGVIDVVADLAPRKASPLSVMVFYRLDGAYTQVPDDATAFGGGRSPRYMLAVIGEVPVPELLPAEREWVRSVHGALQRHAMGKATYVNSLDAGETAEVVASYGPKYARLARIKAAYDPDNVFHRNANIAV